MNKFLSACITTMTFCFKAFKHSNWWVKRIDWNYLQELDIITNFPITFCRHVHTPLPPFKRRPWKLLTMIYLPPKKCSFWQAYSSQEKSNSPSMLNNLKRHTWSLRKSIKFTHITFIRIYRNSNQKIKSSFRNHR